LESEPWHAKKWYRRSLFYRQQKSVQLELMLDASASAPDAFLVRDFPVSYSPIYREYTYRFAKGLVDGVSVDNAFPEKLDFFELANSSSDVVELDLKSATGIKLEDSKNVSRYNKDSSDSTDRVSFANDYDEELTENYYNEDSSDEFDTFEESLSIIEGDE
jgi:hypothetical protein